MNTSKFIILYVPCKNKKEAKKISKILVSKKIAACTNIFPKIASIYQWEEDIEFSSESVMFVKTNKENEQACRTQIEESHSYSCPCILTLSIENINQAYQNWLTDQLSEKSK